MYRLLSLWGELRERLRDTGQFIHELHTIVLTTAAIRADSHADPSNNYRWTTRNQNKL